MGLYMTSVCFLISVSGSKSVHVTLKQNRPGWALRISLNLVLYFILLHKIAINKGMYAKQLISIKYKMCNCVKLFKLKGKVRLAITQTIWTVIALLFLLISNNFCINVSLSHGQLYSFYVKRLLLANFSAGSCQGSCSSLAVKGKLHLTF